MIVSFTSSLGLASSGAEISIYTEIPSINRKIYIYTQATYRVIEVLLEINCPLLEAQLVVKNEKHVNRGLWHHRKRGCELNGVSLASFRDIDMFGLDDISACNDGVDEVWNVLVRLHIEGDVFAQFGTKK